MNKIQAASHQIAFQDVSPTVQATLPVSRAVQAAEAGKHLATVLGATSPFTAQQMWAMARRNQIPFVRIGRRVFWQTSAIDAFVAAGGTVALEPVR